MRRIQRLATAVAVAMLMVTGVQAQEQYRSYAEAYNAAARLMSQRKLSEARAPAEAALRLAPDDKAKLNVYQMLSRVYRELPEIDKKMEADEFVIRHSDRRASRSLPARDLASFLFQRGKLDAGIERYEGVLKENPDDVAALSVLAEIYERPKPDPKRAAEVNERLEEVNRQIARKHAERLENEAAASAQATASLLKDAAQFWLEAGDKPKARAAARHSAESPAEARSEILTFYWREGLGDVFLATAEPQLAVEQYEAALKATSIDPIKRNAEKKLAEAKQAALIKGAADK